VRSVLAAVAISLVATQGVVAQGDSPTCKIGPFSDRAVCGDRDDSPGQGRRRAAPVARPDLNVWRAYLRQLPDGTYCYVFSDRPGPEDILSERPDLTHLLVSAHPCPPADAAEAAVREFWETVVLPRPEPRIQPGKAITGKDAYLEIGGERARAYTITNPLGGPPIVIEATAQYVVDWGDGTTTTTASQGGPWPDGDVTHVWTTAGRYDVVVAQQWSATWSAGPAGGALRGLETFGRLDGFPVIEVQAVRNR
jgi:hypothetical protein